MALTVKLPNAIAKAWQHGQQIWLDNLSRDMLLEGDLDRLINAGVRGITTNPAIFQKAIAGGKYYRLALAELSPGLSPEQRYEKLAIRDVKLACEKLHGVFQQSQNKAGFVSLEVSPALANNDNGTVVEAKRLASAVGEKNLLIKAPATAAGIRALEELTAAGISTNITLIFGRRQYREVAQAYQRGLQKALAGGISLASIHSVASFFLSRIDSAIDPQLAVHGNAASHIQGKTALALAKTAYADFQQLFATPFAELAAAGANPQMLLWASTGTKNPAYFDLLYVEPLIGAATVNTLPQASLMAFLDHGKIKAATLSDDLAEYQGLLQQLPALGIDVEAIAEKLLGDGLALFEEAFTSLLQDCAE